VSRELAGLPSWYSGTYGYARRCAGCKEVCVAALATPQCRAYGSEKSAPETAHGLQKTKVVLVLSALVWRFALMLIGSGVGQGLAVIDGGRRRDSTTFWNNANFGSFAKQHRPQWLPTTLAQPVPRRY